MRRATHARNCIVVALVMLANSPGCLIEVADDPDRHLSITGKVTYRGEPVKKGMISFLPVDPANPSATGAIADGEIKDVFTRTPGDGIRSGKYKIAITTFDEAFLKSVAKRDFMGPDPVEVARAADKYKSAIPLRYNNARMSGLTADFSTSNHSLQLELVD